MLWLLLTILNLAETKFYEFQGHWDYMLNWVTVKYKC